MPHEILIQDTSIAARDGFSLAATVFTPDGPPRAAVLIASATAVPRKIYRPFATYLAERGATVLTFDYRGIGGSRPQQLKGFPARMRDWASLDLAASVDHMRNVWRGLPLHLVGHSFGGQALGLLDNNAAIDRALLVAAQAGYWRYLAGWEKYRVYLVLRVVVPPIARALGYVPGSKLRLGEDLPKDVFLEWASWCMRPRYFLDDPTLPALANFPNFRGPLRVIGFADDPWATPKAIDVLLSGFSGTQPEHLTIAPRDVGARKIGHFGFFRPASRETLWRPAADWLLGE